ncbi:hypothetical protein A176_007040 [Myxococcus hansupus]|uniref:Uncharacterized protein n=1 Tax=Pseudomyxococcus hansupus TaxID=1297742 RepID=A0A0H4X852_9BACT|nr:hypothetical protein A176_007040 [Myxococcus hansupus]
MLEGNAGTVRRSHLAALPAPTGMSDPRVIHIPVAHTRVSGPGGPSSMLPLRPHRHGADPPARVCDTPFPRARRRHVARGGKARCPAMGVGAASAWGGSSGPLSGRGAVSPGGWAAPIFSPRRE